MDVHTIGDLCAFLYIRNTPKVVSSTGAFSAADAMYAPVVMRFKTYGVSLAPALQAYCERVEAHPAVARWMREALAETEAASKHDDELPQ